jgi:hypothetical protein
MAGYSETDQDQSPGPVSRTSLQAQSPGPVSRPSLQAGLQDQPVINLIEDRSPGPVLMMLVSWTSLQGHGLWDRLFVSIRPNILLQRGVPF